MCLKKLSLLAMAWACTSIVEAAEITQTKYFGESAVFTQFDSTLGTLNSIRIDVTLNISGGQLNFDNDGSSAISGTLKFGQVVSLTYTSDVSLYDSAYQMILDNGKVFAYNSYEYNLAADNGDGQYNYDSTSPDGCIYDGSNLSFSDSGYIASGFWNQGTKGFIGTGTYNIIYSINQWNNLTGSNIEYYFSPTVSSDGWITVTYSYDAVPEPCAIMLMGAGIAFFVNKSGKCQSCFGHTVL